MKRTLSASVIATLLILGPIAVTPVQASASPSTNLAIVNVKVTDLTTGSTTLAGPGDWLRFVAVVKNFGPDESADLKVDPFSGISGFYAYGPRSGCLFNSYSNTGPQYDGCHFLNVPAGTKFKATRIVGSPASTGTASVTFCAVAGPGQVDPNSANDCKTGSIQVV